MAKFILTTQTNIENQSPKTVSINVDNITYAIKIASDASEVRFIDGTSIIVKTPIEDLI